MDKEPKLKVDLEFQFNTEDLEVPVLDFLSEDPIEKKSEIKILKKKKGAGRKPSAKLF